MPWEPEPDEYLLHTFTSPDSALRVEDWEEANDRGAPYRNLRVIARATGETVIHIGSAVRTAEPEFPNPHEVILYFDYSGVATRVTINARARTFAEHPGEEEPLDRLFQWLADRIPRAAPPSAIYSVSLRELLVEVFMLLGALLMTAAALFCLLFLAKDWRQRWEAIAGLVLFGAAAVSSAYDLRRMYRARKKRPPRPSDGTESP
ncbi:MAG TPA: hypothetical protein VK689_22455 [Armatimonadota bacterium]|nr:hypothetical protein [Armatimonadota bacterium]